MSKLTEVLVEVEKTPDGRRRFVAEPIRLVGTEDGRDVYESIPAGMIEVARDRDITGRLNAMENKSIELFYRIKDERLSHTGRSLAINDETALQEQTDRRLELLDGYKQSIRSLRGKQATATDIAAELKRIGHGLDTLLASVPLIVSPPPKPRDDTLDYLSPSVAREIREMRAEGLNPGAGFIANV